MKFQVYELVLNEYVNHPVKVFLEEVEASTVEEANRIVRTIHPNKVSLRIGDQDFDA